MFSMSQEDAARIAADFAAYCRETDEGESHSDGLPFRDIAMTLHTLRLFQLASRLSLARGEHAILIYVAPNGTIKMTSSYPATLHDDLREVLRECSDDGGDFNNPND